MKYAKITEAVENLAVKNGLKNIRANIRTAIEKSFYRIGKDLKTDARRRVNDPTTKTGRIYTKRLTRLAALHKKSKIGMLVSHQASAPGESPARFSGDLTRSIDYTINGHDRLIFGAGGRDSKVNYARFLELGTAKIKPRPFLKPAMQVNFRNMELELTTTIRTFIIRGPS